LKNSQVDYLTIGGHDCVGKTAVFVGASLLAKGCANGFREQARSYKLQTDFTETILSSSWVGVAKQSWNGGGRSL
jgi:hypothetical protein